MAFMAPFVGRDYPLYGRNGEESRSVSASFSSPRKNTLPSSSSSATPAMSSAAKRHQQRPNQTKPRSRTVSESKSFEMLLAQREQRLADYKKKKQANIKRRHTAVLRKISEQNETGDRKEDDLVFDRRSHGFTTLERLREEPEDENNENFTTEMTPQPVQRSIHRPENPSSDKKKKPFFKLLRWIAKLRL